MHTDYSIHEEIIEYLVCEVLNDHLEGMSIYLSECKRSAGALKVSNAGSGAYAHCVP